ncbi:hypothetical protein AC578_6300 [Pseudocercospora eumusae]|uniref:Potassium transporter n=1 Tax=Pseudocercospora eumusae TaxID=321146 RepID=A0A139H213_9PEZI|nr:hypothetical protein AC578_6300 [Pseudocercospora eumusae]
MAQRGMKFDDEDQITAVQQSHPGSDTMKDGIVFSRNSNSQAGGGSTSRCRRHKTNTSSDEERILHPQDVKNKQKFQGTQLFMLAYQSIGVIYGDIGTSPLYVYSSTFTTAPARDDVIGVLSLIVWSLVTMVTLKYVFVILNADNEGEGGTFSCYALLSRYAKITERDPREEALVRMERYGTEEMHGSNLRVRRTMESSRGFKAVLKGMGVFAVSMVMSDGVLTPAQSVLGAVQGLNVVVPDIGNGAVVGATCGILILLFVVQPFGTAKIGTVFAPIIMIWLGLLAAFGIYNLVNYDTGVFKAFNPGEAFDYLIRHGEEGWHSLGGVLLAFTGVEALFADLGAFSMRAIQISWLGYCLPCLLLTYIGQAAYLAVHPEAYTYPVFNTAPPGCLILSMVIAILSAIVASQAIITATFQLLAQIVKLSYFPQIQVVHTSKTYHNQLYVPLANYLLCLGTVVITAVFRNTTSLGQAYGVCVMFVTFFDTQMATLTSLIVWRFRPWMVVLPWLAISAMDGAFLSSALTKVPDGAWFTLTLASVLAGVFIMWRFGKEQQWRAERQDRNPLIHYIKKDEDGNLHLASDSGKPTGEALSVIKGFGLFFDKAGDKTPIIFSQFVSKLVSKPEVTVFFHLRPLESPTVDLADRYVVQKIAYLKDCYRVVARYGYMDEVVTPDLASLIYARIREHIILEHGNITGKDTADAAAIAGDLTKTDAGVHAVGDVDEKLPAYTSQNSVATIDANGESIPLSLARLQQAFEHRVLYIIGKEELELAPKTNWWRLVLLKIFLFARENTRNKMANLKVPTDKLVEIGFVMNM